MFRIAAYLCAVAAIVLAGWGVALSLRDEPEDAIGDEPAFVVDNPERDIGEVKTGPIDVAFDVTNPARRPRRIIGFAEG